MSINFIVKCGEGFKIFYLRRVVKVYNIYFLKLLKIDIFTNLINLSSNVIPCCILVSL